MVSDLESKYAKRGVQEAQAARDLQRRLAAPPDTKLMKALSDGTIQGTTVTAEHVRRAISIHGPTLESIKGRTTRKKGIAIPVTDHHRVTDTQTMYIDVFFACTVSHHKSTAPRSHYDIPTARKICNSHKKSFSTTHRVLWSTWNPYISSSFR